MLHRNAALLLILYFSASVPETIALDSINKNFWFNAELMRQDPVVNPLYPLPGPTLPDPASGSELPTYESAHQRSDIPQLEIPNETNWQNLNTVIWSAFFDNLKPATASLAARLSAQFKESFDGVIHENQFFWDQAFINLGFGHYAYKAFSTLGGLDSFYHRQHIDGFIPRELNSDGSEVRFFKDQHLLFRIERPLVLNGRAQLPALNFEKQKVSPEIWKQYEEYRAPLLSQAEELKKLYGQHNNTNPPLAAHAEWRHYLLTRDKVRLYKVLPVLQKHTEWLEQNRQLSDGELSGLFWQSPMGSGMDNLPEDDGSMEWDFWQDTMKEAAESPAPDYPRLLTEKQHASFDISAQMKLHYDAMARIEHTLGYQHKAADYQSKSEALSAKINDCMWDDDEGFYFSVKTSCQQKNKLFALSGYWALYARIASTAQAERMLAPLKDEKHFNTYMPFPALSASHPLYDEHGNYWRGGVWPPLFYITIMGLMNYALEIPEAWELAVASTKNHLDKLADTVFGDEKPALEPGLPAAKEYRDKIYEYYSSSTGGMGLRSDTEGEQAKAKSNFVGWGGLPAGLMIQVSAGINVEEEEIVWYMNRNDHHGIRDLHIGTGSISMILKPESQLSLSKEDIEITGDVTLLRALGIKGVRIIPQFSTYSFYISLSEGNHEEL